MIPTRACNIEAQIPPFRCFSFKVPGNVHTHAETSANDVKSPVKHSGTSTVPGKGSDASRALTLSQDPDIELISELPWNKSSSDSTLFKVCGISHFLTTLHVYDH